MSAMRKKKQQRKQLRRARRTAFRPLLLHPCV